MNRRIVIIVYFLLVFGISSQAQWVQTNGPRNETPTFSEVDYCLASIGNDLFVGTASSGVLRSSDSGSTWDTVNNGLIDYSVYSLLFNKGNLYAGTSGGLYLSNDSGASWNHLPLEPKFSSQVSAIVAIGSNLIVGFTTDFTYLSTDNGNTWSETGSDTLFGTISFAVMGTNLFAGTSSFGGVFLSTDNGASWAPTDTGPVVIRSLAVSGTYLFVGTYKGMYYSNNYGTSWNPIDSGLPSGSYVSALAVTGQNIYAGTFGSGMYLSTNNGVSWSAVTGNGMIDPTIYSFLINGGNFYAGTYEGGVFLSTDNGTNWTVHNPLTLINSRINSLDTIGQELFACTQAGLFSTLDSGASWTLDSNGMGNVPVNAVLSISDTIFVGTSGHGLFFSTNNGTSWVADTNVNAGSSIYALVQNNGVLYPSSTTPFAIMGTIMISGSQNYIYYSPDSGRDSYVVIDGPPPTPINSLVVMGGNVYAGTGDGVWVSNDSGVDWNPSTDSALIDMNVTTLLVNGNTLFAGTNSGFIFVSSDTGATWSEIGGLNVGGTEITSLAMQDSVLYAGSPDSGIWRHSLSHAQPSGIVGQSLTTVQQIYTYPNPLSQSTEITFTLPEASEVTLTITDATGCETPLLRSAWFPAGQHEIAWDASNYPSGVYLCRLSSGGESVTERVVVLK